MAQGTLIPGTSVAFGQEKTEADCLARARWEREQAKRLEADGNYGRILAPGHTRTAEAYEELAARLCVSATSVAYPALPPRFIVSCPYPMHDPIIEMERRAKPHLRGIEGLWRRACKGTRGSVAHPGSMTEYIETRRRLAVVSEAADCSAECF